MKGIPMEGSHLQHLAAGASQHEPMSPEQLANSPENLAERADRHRRMMVNAGIPPRYFTRTLDNFDMQDMPRALVLEACKAYAARVANGETEGAALLLIGTVGTGKTHLAIGIARVAMASGKKARYTTVYEMLLDIRSTYRKDADRSEAQAIKGFTTPDILVLDEVGNQRGTEDETIQIFRVINARYNALLPTVIISNLAVDDLEAYTGTPALDRLREGGGKVLVCQWPSWRRRK